jgi:hypothetical protein
MLVSDQRARRPSRPRWRQRLQRAVGGTCTPFSLRTEGGHWPVHPASAGYLGLVSDAPRIPTDQSPGLITPRVVGEEHLLGLHALVLWIAPSPAGGLHGGHYAIVWDEDHAGYVVTVHYLRGGRGLPSRASDLDALERTIADLRHVAPQQRPAASSLFQTISIARD